MTTIIGWLFLIASWTVPKYVFPDPADYKKKYGFALVLSILSLATFVVGWVIHVHGPGCEH